VNEQWLLKRAAPWRPVTTCPLRGNANGAPYTAQPQWHEGAQIHSGDYVLDSSEVLRRELFGARLHERQTTSCPDNPGCLEG
jgi:hypothetical protein